MDLATLTSKGQITIPAAVRGRLRLQTGDQVLFIEENGKIYCENADQIDRFRQAGKAAASAAALVAATKDGKAQYSDLDDLAGTWIDDPEFDGIIADLDRVDEELWK